MRLAAKDAKYIMQHNENITSVSLNSTYVEGKKILNVFRLEASHDVD
jgi:hypothetical protein